MRDRSEYHKQYRLKQLELDPEGWKAREKYYNEKATQRRRENTEERLKHNAYARKDQKARREKERQSVITFLGGKCKKCGFSDYRALQIDHINGGGSKEYKAASSKSTYHRTLYKDVRENSQKYQLLCANCNWIKRYEEGETNLS